MREVLKLLPNLVEISIGLNRLGGSLLRVLRNHCGELEKLELVMYGSRPPDIDLHMNEVSLLLSQTWTTLMG